MDGISSSEIPELFNDNIIDVTKLQNGLYFKDSPIAELLDASELPPPGIIHPIAICCYV